MQYEDRIPVATPEGITLDVTLAGLGSRFVAALLDWLLRGAMLFALSILVGVAGAGEEQLDAVAALMVAVFFIATFLIIFGYDVLFETLGSGRTPGKRWTGLRVVRVGGRPVGFLASAVRNVLRIADFLPFGYFAGMIAIIATERNQRLGDLAAGTLVVRERQGDRKPIPVTGYYATSLPEEYVTWDVTAVTSDELATVRRFLERRVTLAPEARARLAWDLAARLGAKVAGHSGYSHPEIFLEQVVLAKARRG